MNEELLRPLEVGEQFLMRASDFSDASNEMVLLAGKWLTVSRVGTTRYSSERAYHVEECSDRWIWTPHDHMDIEETNKRIRISDFQKMYMNKSTPRLPRI